MQSRRLVIALFNGQDYQAGVPSFLKPPENQRLFSVFIKVAYNETAFQKLTTGNKQRFNEVQEIMRQLFQGVENNKEYREMVEHFVKQQVIMSAFKFLNLKPAGEELVDWYL